MPVGIGAARAARSACDLQASHKSLVSSSSNSVCLFARRLPFLVIFAPHRLHFDPCLRGWWRGFFRAVRLEGGRDVGLWWRLLCDVRVAGVAGLLAGASTSGSGVSSRAHLLAVRGGYAANSTGLAGE